MLRRIPLLVTALALAATAACTNSATSASDPLPGSSDAPSPAAAPALRALGEGGGKVAWKRPLTLSVTNGTLTDVAVMGPDGTPFAGALNGSTWTSAETLVPNQKYAATVKAKDSAGKTQTLSRAWRATPPDKTLHVTISPGPGAVVGVAQPIVVRFDQKVSGRAARLAVLAKLNVTTTPAVEGAWRWYNSFEAHYHAEKYWTSGTKIAVSADLSNVHVPGTGVWGATKAVTSTITIGKDYESTVDIAKHTMTVFENGKLIRTIKVSTGRDKYPTKGGVHIVLTREKSHTYNSGTVGIPTNGPGGYYEKLPWSMRISNGGAFVHANPATVGVQGRRNVSHGCVNTSVADAKWFYYHSQLGDPVNIINAVVKPVKWDAGMADWNYTWAEWKAGNLDG